MRPYCIKYCLFVIILAVSLPSSVLCNNQLSSKGLDFCLGFRSISLSGLAYAVIISTDEPTSVQFTITYSGGTVTHSTVKDDPYIVLLGTTNTNVADSSYANRHHGVCIKSTSAPLFVTAYTRLNNDATASFLVLPYQEIIAGHYEYYALSVAGSSASYYSGVVLIAYKDDTSITIHPSIPLTIPNNTQDSNSVDIVIGPGESHTVILHRRETLYIGKDGSGVDVTGTRIVSDKPLTVISGHEAGAVPISGSLEPMAQQIPPTQLWGDRFMIAPLQGSLHGSLVKLVAAYDNTRLTYECSGGENGEVNITEAGESAQFSVSTDVFCYLEASNAVLVGQFPRSPSSNGFDTTMIIIPSIEQYTPDPSFYTLNSTSNGNVKHYVSIIVPANYYQEDTILYDGSVITHDNWVAVYHNGTVMGYGCTMEVESLLSKPHTINRADTVAHFLVIAYGFNIGRAYGYIAGLTIPTDRALGFKLSTELGYSTVEFEGSASLSAHALYNISRDVTFSYTTVALQGITPGSDYTTVNEQEIVYKAHADGFEYTIDIHDDHLTEADEILRVDLCTEFSSKTLCIENMLTIVDNDEIVIGLSDIVYDAGDNDMKVEVAVQSGQLQPSYFLEVKLNLTVSFQDEPIISFAMFSSYTKSHTIDFSLNSVTDPFKVTAVLSKVEDDTQNALLLGLDPNTKDVMITPNPTTTSDGNNQQPTHNMNSKETYSIITTTLTNLSPTQETNMATDNGIAPTGEGIKEDAGLLADNFLINVIIPIAGGVAVLLIATLLCSIVTAHYIKKRKNRRGIMKPNLQYELPPNQLTAIRNNQIDTAPPKTSAMPRQVLVTPRHSQGGRGRDYRSVPLLHEMATPPSFNEVEKGEEVPVPEKVMGEERETEFNSNEQTSSSEEDDSSSDGHDSIN